MRAARSCIGTPFHHQQRTPGVGLDCAGLILAVAASCGFPCRDHPRRDYARGVVVGRRLYEFCAEQLEEVHPEGACPGSVLLFWVRRPGAPQHLAIMTEDGRMVHAWHEAGRVIEISMGPYWEARLHAAFDFEGVA